MFAPKARPEVVTMNSRRSIGCIWCLSCYGSRPVGGRSAGDSREQQITPLTRLADRPTRRPADPPTGRPADRPTRRPADPPTGRPADRPTRRPADPPTGRPADRPTRRPADPPTGRLSEPGTMFDNLQDCRTFEQMAE